MEPEPNMELHKFSNGRFILLKNNYDVEVFPVQQFGVCLVQIIILEAVKGKHILFIININDDDDDDDGDDDDDDDDNYYYNYYTAV